MGTQVATEAPLLVRLEFVEGPSLPLLELSSLLYDMELVHDLGILITESRYADYHITPSFWQRSGRPLADSDRLRVRTDILASPLILELLAALPFEGSLMFVDVRHVRRSLSAIR